MEIPPPCPGSKKLHPQGGGARKMQSITLISIMDDLRTLCILLAPDLSLFYKRYIYNVIVRYRLVKAKTSTLSQKTSTPEGGGSGHGGV